jgi:hypothetical protein
VVANVPHTAHNGFLFSDHRAGELVASQPKKDADVWIIARALKLPDSRDPVVRLSARAQLAQNITKGFSGKPLPLMTSPVFLPKPSGASAPLSGSFRPSLSPTPSTRAVWREDSHWATP